MNKRIRKAGLSAIGLALISDLCNYLGLIATSKIFETLAIFGVVFILIYFIVKIPMIDNTLKSSYRQKNTEGNDESKI